MAKIFWLRAETKENEFRRAITPDSCKKIIEAGHTVYAEDWNKSIIPTSDYKDAGCIITPANSWQSDAPDNAIIIGLKALPENIENFKHTHIYFAHAYKKQDGWRELLSKFDKGGGKIIDLEFMLDQNNRRVCAFGYWAGYVGAALGALFSHSTDQKLSIDRLNNLKSFPDQQALTDFVTEQTMSAQGSAIVIGSAGRSGAGAQDFLKAIKWKVTPWDREQTSGGGPFKEILEHDLFVNCVLAMKKMPPFITKEIIEQANKKLKVISDVSCDPDSECNMVPLYDKATILSSPLVQATTGDNPVYITAIDNLPTILPKESSYDFSGQLSPYIESYNEGDGPILAALRVYSSCVSEI